jgi:hypothetical protein
LKRLFFSRFFNQKIKTASPSHRHGESSNGQPEVKEVKLADLGSSSFLLGIDNFKVREISSRII